MEPFVRDAMYGAVRLAQVMSSPVHSFAKVERNLWSHPAFFLSQTPFGRASAAMLEVVERATRHYGKPAFGLGAEEVVLETPFCKLVHFASGKAGAPKVLLVAPLSGHYPTLLRDTVQQLLIDHDVWVTDWTNARLVPLAAGSFDLDDYVLLVQQFLRHIGPGVHVVAVCQPCVPVLAAVSLMAEDNDLATPRSMTLMAGPVDARISMTEVGRLAVRNPLEWFRDTVIQRVPAGDPGFARKVYPGYLQLSAFVSMNPNRHAASYRKFYLDLLAGDQESAASHRRFYDEYLAVLDLPAEYFLQTVQSVFQTFDLARGEMRVRGRLVRPEAIQDTTLFTVEGDKDDITGLGQTAAAHTLCSSIPEAKKFRLIQKDVGHYGVFSGRRWREQIAPRVAEVIRGAAVGV